MTKHSTPPILFLIFNRPDTTFEVFNSIKKAKPKQLFIASDGPRNNKLGEKEIVVDLREKIISKIDWPCEVKTLFKEENLGCGKSVSSAISWFFSNVTEGVIIEDDCVPNQDFYPYMSELLNKYRDDKSVKFIGGSNFQNGNQRGDGSYYFSKYCHVWGWGTWKEVWEQYKYDLSNVSEEELSKILKDCFKDLSMYNNWHRIFKKMITEPIDTWDYQLDYSIWKNNGVSIIPNVNLVSNIGFGEDATHTKNKYSVYANHNTGSILPIVHPSVSISHDYQADEYFFFNFEKRSLAKRTLFKISLYTNKILYSLRNS